MEAIIEAAKVSGLRSLEENLLDEVWSDEDMLSLNAKDIILDFVDKVLGNVIQKYEEKLKECGTKDLSGFFRRLEKFFGSKRFSMDLKVHIGKLWLRSNFIVCLARNAKQRNFWHSNLISTLPHQTEFDQPIEYQ